MDLIQLHSGNGDKLINDNKDYLVHGESRIGGRPENQDTMGARQTALGYVVTVCDGMGGGPGGKTASKSLPSPDRRRSGKGGRRCPL